MQQLKGRFVKQGYSNGGNVVVLSVDQSIKQEYIGKDLTIDIKQFRKDRSLDANAYYWVLVGKLADAVGESQPYIHNEMIRKYGQTEVFDGQLIRAVIPNTEESEKKVNEALDYHLRPTSEIRKGKDGKDYRTYVMMRGSSTYNSKEFSTLLNGIIFELNELGISTMTPDELLELKGYER